MTSRELKKRARDVVDQVVGTVENLTGITGRRLDLAVEREERRRFREVFLESQEGRWVLEQILAQLGWASTTFTDQELEHDAARLAQYQRFAIANWILRKCGVMNSQNLRDVVLSISRIDPDHDLDRADVRVDAAESAAEAETSWNQLSSIKDIHRGE